MQKEKKNTNQPKPAKEQKGNEQEKGGKKLKVGKVEDRANPGYRVSDRDAKENFAGVDTRAVLRRLSVIPVLTRNN